MKSEPNSNPFFHPLDNKDEIQQSRSSSFSRRSFLGTVGMGGAMALGFSSCSNETKPADGKVIQGFDETSEDADPYKGWEPFSDRKVRVGLVGYGLCTFAAAFGFQDHPNVEVVAVSDLIPERCQKLAERVKCKKVYPSLEEMVKDDNIEAIFVATDAPSHARHCIEVLKHGKHVATAVPATWGSIEEGEALFEVVKKNRGLKYMMFETSLFRQNLYAMRQIYKAGSLGTLVYSEGEYWHYDEKGIPSFKGWRDGSPPQWYPTHATAYHIGVNNGYYTEVSCVGFKTRLGRYEGNKYNNPFATEIAMFKTNDGGISRMSKSSDTPGRGGEVGRIRGTRGTYYDKYEGLEKNLPNTKRPPLPPGVPPGHHGGSHGPLMDEFIHSIIEDRQPLCDIVMALNLTVPGIVAHESALRGGEWLKVPHYSWT